MSETRVCKECGNEYPLTLEYFPKGSNKNKLTFRKICVTCTKRIAMDNYYKNWDKRQEYNKKWREDNSEHRKEYNREYGKQYRENNKEKVSEYNKEYAISHREELNEYSRKYYKINSEKICNRNSERYKKIEIKNKHKIHVRNWYENNKEKVTIYTNSYRAKKKELPFTLTRSEWEDIKKHFNNKCAYCGKDAPLTQDHFIALSKGGEYTINNIIPSCQSCNSSKNNKDFFTWYHGYEHYSKVREKKITKYLNYKNNIQQLTLTK